MSSIPIVARRPELPTGSGSFRVTLRAGNKSSALRVRYFIRKASGAPSTWCPLENLQSRNSSKSAVNLLQDLLYLTNIHFITLYLKFGNKCVLETSKRICLFQTPTPFAKSHTHNFRFYVKKLEIEIHKHLHLVWIVFIMCFRLKCMDCRWPFFSATSCNSSHITLPVGKHSYSASWKPNCLGSRKPGWRFTARHKS